MKNMKPIISIIVAAMMVFSGLGGFFMDEVAYADSGDIYIPEGAGYFDGHYYFIFDALGSGEEGYAEAANRCASMGGYLATISDERENIYLFNY